MRNEEYGTTLVKKLMFSALKKMVIHGVNMRLFRAESGQLGRAGLNGHARQLGHIQW